MIDEIGFKTGFIGDRLHVSKLSDALVAKCYPQRTDRPPTRFSAVAALELRKRFDGPHRKFGALDRVANLTDQASCLRSSDGGNGGLFLDFELERGADGAMTGYCYPELLVSLVNLSGRGAREEAHDVFDAHLPLLRYEQQPGLGLAVRKYVMKERGLLTSDFQRSPAVPLSPTARAEVAFLRQRLESAQGGAFVKVLQ